jgi:DNA-binding Lrp family transcriptional regulator
MKTKAKAKEKDMENQLKAKILKLIEKNAKTPNADIATVVGISEAEVAAAISEMEKDGTIRGYKAVIDWKNVERESVSAIIELKVVPKERLGFEEVAERIARYKEVDSVSLMSGACDLNVVVKGKTFGEVSNFVAKELATLEGVTSTATQFVMRGYKEFGVQLFSDADDERGTISL